MAYDHDLADRIREQIGGDPALTERKMFGGLAFLVGGHMAVAASGTGGMMVRVDPVQTERLLRSAGVTRVEMGGRSMNGWLRVDTDHLRTTRQLERWVGLGTTFARSLPPKR